MALIISICEGFAYIYSGMYGDINKLGAGNAILILIQLTFAGIVCVLLDEMLQNGYFFINTKRKNVYNIKFNKIF